MSTEEILASMVDSGKIPHAILLHENDGGGAFPVAISFLEKLYGGAGGRVAKLIHSDVHFIFPALAPASSASSVSPSEPYLGEFRKLAGENPRFTEQDLWEVLGIEGKNPVISVAEANALLRVLGLHSLEGGYTAAVIYLPERMNAAAANKLLKMLEEPPSQTVFVLITHAPEKLLATIVSRCQMFRVQSPLVSAVDNYDDGGLLAALMSALLARDLAAALSEGEQIAAMPSKDSAKGFCRYAAEKFRRVFLYQQGLSTLVPDDPEAREWAGRVSPKFPRKALEILDRTVGRIDRNVNVKILFTDLVDRLFINI